MRLRRGVARLCPFTELSLFLSFYQFTGLNGLLTRAIGEVAQDEYTIVEWLGDVFHEPLYAGENGCAVWLAQRHDYDAGVLRMEKRHRVIKVTVGGKNRCAKPLGGCEHGLVTISKVTGFIEENRLVPARLDEVGGGTRKVLIEKELHGAVALSAYGMSSNWARCPAKANIAERSSDEMLG